MVKVSVIIPVYNAEKYLNQCISSIANQTMQDIEIIAINDGSTDNSLNVLDELSQRYKGKLKVYTKENSGAGSARNIGIENASGEFIKFVDAKYPDWQENKIIELYKFKNGLFQFDMNRLNKYTNNEYRNVDRETAESNIRTSLQR